MKHRPSHHSVLAVVAFSLVGITVRAAAPATDSPVSASTTTTSTAASGATTLVTPLPTQAALLSKATALPPHTANYTVVKGDSLTTLANKFNTTRRKLKDLNSLADSKIIPGQVILVPSYKKSSKANAAAGTKPKPHHTYALAQPVQDFDVPASTFASCPVPEPDENADAPAPALETTREPAAPIALLVSPNELAADQATQKKKMAMMTLQQKAAINKAVTAAALQAASASVATAPVPPAPAPSSSTFSAKRGTTGATTKFAPSGLASSASTPPPAGNHPGLLAFFRAHPAASTPSNDWGNRFLQESRALGAQGIEYDESWRPPGEPRSWDMDCSNTSRYLYKVTTGIVLPRTASDQYYYLHLQGKAWDVPTTQFGWANGEYLRSHLKPGDLLFWENTYRPERTPPITHVMVFLGTNAQGQWIMAGSQSSRGGEHNRRNGGPDIYLFHPSQACGGYTTWLGMVHHKGRFCAFGRPLDADPSKFALND